MHLPAALRASDSILAAELRPPRAELSPTAGMEAWIDTYHAVRGLTRQGTYAFLTDGAVGTREEDNLRHLVANLGDDAPRDHVVPFLTSKHPLPYCLAYADRAWEHGFRSLVVLGGDRSVGPPRSVAHGWELRQRIRSRLPDLCLGGWANPHADPAAQVGYLLDADVSADFYLTQIVSHHDTAAVDRFMNEAVRRGLAMPAVFGVFFYRSDNLRTLATLRRFLPVPADAIAREFASGATPATICARSIRALRRLGVRHVYISNLPVNTAAAAMRTILDLVETEGD